ncbi:MAG: sodium:solute symporter family protein [Candidatus Schekmanbacteria bacterium]|nr:MAG: sodium:solute symporter family protein [Candidatus Schekmanbacteria bacterium]
MEIQNPLIFGIIISYIFLITLIGSLFYKKSTTSEGWAIGSSSLGIIFAAAGVAGIRIGGVATYGVAGDVITGGVWNMWYGLSHILAMLFFALFFAKIFRRLQLFSSPQIFNVRFNRKKCQILGSLCVQTELFIVMVIEIYLTGKILNAVTTIPLNISIFIAATIFIFYVSIGGIWGSAVTNLIHVIVIYFGLTAVAIFGLQYAGGWDKIVSKVDYVVPLISNGEISVDKWWSPIGGGIFPLLAMQLSAIIHTPAVSAYVNFASAGKDEKTSFNTFIIAGIISAFVPIIAGIIGIETLAVFGTSAVSKSYYSITKLAMCVNPLIGGIALAAVTAAIISSAAPILLSCSTMIVEDWVCSVTNLTPRGKIIGFRATTVLYGYTAAITAMLFPVASVLKLLLFAFAVVVPPATAIAYIIYYRATTEYAVFWGMLIGYSGGLLWYLFGNTDKIDPVFICLFSPLILIPILSRVTAYDYDEAKKFYERL